MIRATPKHLVVGLEGPVPTAAERAWLAEHQPRGVILFSRNVIDYSQLCDLCSGLKSLVPGLEISADHEGGAVSQLAAAVGRPPAAWALGVLDDVGLTVRVHEETGRRLATAGIDRVYAPVADIMTEPRNPVIGSRAFGADPGAVTRQVVAAVTGLLSGGVGVCVKHWPGHGGTDRDTHRDSAAADGTDLAGSFLAAVEAGADAVMAGHLHLEARTTKGVPLPASLDREALKTVRRVLDPRNDRTPLLICDDVTMGGLGEAMRGLGVPVPDPEPQGMFRPGDLPAAWLDHLVDAGHDRLLLRGIPWGAFPLAGEEKSPADEQPDQTSVGHAFQPGPYDEARRRLWAQASDGFGDRNRTLVWWDLSAEDRWQVATGGVVGPESILKVLEGQFQKVVRVTDPEGLESGVSRLLVSSHRPLPALGDRLDFLASEGLCLALGHPSAGHDLAAQLGSKWRVGALFDVFAGDLFPDSGQPTKI